MRGFKKEQITKLEHIPRDDRQGDRPPSDDLATLRQQCKLDDVTETSKIRKGMSVSLKNMRVSPGRVTGAAATEPWVSRRIGIPRPDNGVVSGSREVTVGPSGLYIGCNQGASVGCIGCVHIDSPMD